MQENEKVVFPLINSVNEYTVRNRGYISVSRAVKEPTKSETDSGTDSPLKKQEE